MLEAAGSEPSFCSSDSLWSWVSCQVLGLWCSSSTSHCLYIPPVWPLILTQKSPVKRSRSTANKTQSLLRCKKPGGLILEAVESEVLCDENEWLGVIFGFSLKCIWNHGSLSARSSRISRSLRQWEHCLGRLTRGLYAQLIQWLKFLLPVNLCYDMSTDHKQSQIKLKTKTTWVDLSCQGWSSFLSYNIL